jgi:ubiquinone/menaquinone biosynthesis C-methylase UbiE
MPCFKVVHVTLGEDEKKRLVVGVVRASPPFLQMRLALGSGTIVSAYGKATMTSSFNVQKASGYEQLMGRWSRRLAPQFIDFAGVKAGERILDVGCGTGSLTFALPKAANISEIVGIDYSPVFVEEANRRNSDPRISIQQADASALPFADGRFDRALALLVLHFVPQASKAVAEMRRVVRPGGVVAAAVWDHLGGLPSMRMVLDSLAPLDEAAARLRGHYCFQPMMRPGEMRETFIAQGLQDVEETSALIRMDYESFDDFWNPIASGEGPLGKYVAALDETRKAKAGDVVRAAFEAGQPDGRRSFAAVAWACRGIVP